MEIKITIMDPCGGITNEEILNSSIKNIITPELFKFNSDGIATHEPMKKNRSFLTINGFTYNINQATGKLTPFEDFKL